MAGRRPPAPASDRRSRCSSARCSRWWCWSWRGTPGWKGVDVSTICVIPDWNASAHRRFSIDPEAYICEMYGRVVRWADSPAGRIRYGRTVNWIERQLERLRSFNPLVVDGVLALIFTVVGIASVFGQDIRDDNGVITDGFREPSVLAIATVLVVCAPVAIRRRAATAGARHLLDRDPDPHPHRLARGCAAARRAVPHLHGRRVVLAAHRAGRVGGHRGRHRPARVRRFTRASTRSASSAILAQFIAVWAVGVALRSRRMATDARSARPRNAPRPSVRARRECSPRSGCGSPRSCTTWWPTRCR